MIVYSSYEKLMGNMIEEGNTDHEQNSMENN